MAEWLAGGDGDRGGLGFDSHRARLVKSRSYFFVFAFWPESDQSLLFALCAAFSCPERHGEAQDGEEEEGRR